MEETRSFDAFGFIESGLTTPDEGLGFAAIITNRAEAGIVAPIRVDATSDKANRDFVIIGILLVPCRG